MKRKLRNYISSSWDEDSAWGARKLCGMRKSSVTVVAWIVCASIIVCGYRVCSNLTVYCSKIERNVSSFFGKYRVCTYNSGEDFKAPHYKLKIPPRKTWIYLTLPTPLSLLIFSYQKYKKLFIKHEDTRRMRLMMPWQVGGDVQCRTSFHHSRCFSWRVDWKLKRESYGKALGNKLFYAIRICLHSLYIEALKGDLSSGKRLLRCHKFQLRIAHPRKELEAFLALRLVSSHLCVVFMNRECWIVYTDTHTKHTYTQEKSEVIKRKKMM